MKLIPALDDVKPLEFEEKGGAFMRRELIPMGLLAICLIGTANVPVQAAPGKSVKVYGDWETFGPKFGMNAPKPGHGYIEVGLAVTCPAGTEMSLSDMARGFIQFRDKSGKATKLTEKTAPKRVGVPFLGGRTLFRVDAGSSAWTAAVFLNPNGGPRITMRAVTTCRST